MSNLKDWDRNYFEKPLYNPVIFLVVHGNFKVDFNIPSETYRVEKLPEGLGFFHYSPQEHPEVVRQFLEGHIWEEFQKENPPIANQFIDSKECYVIRGEITESENLNYLRDTIGIVTYLLDHGGVGVIDPQGLKVYSKETWKKRIFLHRKLRVFDEVTILVSAQENGEKWFHTRGMRKFGRPDLSVHDVSPDYEAAVTELIDRFIQYQALGGIIKDGEKIKMKSLPNIMRCENLGDFDDVNFNNKHVEIYWNE